MVGNICTYSGVKCLSANNPIILPHKNESQYQGHSQGHMFQREDHKRQNTHVDELCRAVYIHHRGLGLVPGTPWCASWPSERLRADAGNQMPILVQSLTVVDDHWHRRGRIVRNHFVELLLLHLRRRHDARVLRHSDHTRLCLTKACTPALIHE